MSLTGWRHGLLPCLLLSAGCYSFEPLEAPRPGLDVRARLNIEAAVRRSLETEQPQRHVDGQIVEYSGEAIALSVLVARVQSAFQDIVIRDTVRFAMSDIEALHARRLSPLRTALFAGGLAVGAVLAVRGITAIVGGTDGQPGDNGGQANFVPWLPGLRPAQGYAPGRFPP